ncbi:MAG: UDP-GlcNAc--UDP-phosphate GlcNAc-1-phosphate transferase [Cyclobacteriaceae bacterium]|nr:UDP-GlcNAc--UDP-phosphate GlcNAc-1-phosphate transferase [Cyclobacteriaceae bacterium]
MENTTNLSIDNNLWVWPVGAILLVLFEILYIQIARKFSIIDLPSKRSSHEVLTIRGGGIIFYVALIFSYLHNNCELHAFMAGATLVAVVSFLDDVSPRSASLRFGVQTVAVILLFYDAGILTWPLWLLVLAAMVSIGALNAFNFMDGINGITGLYGLINLLSFSWVQYYFIPFTSLNAIIWVMLSVLIFLYFNFRVKAKCFAGDVGSITLAFFQIFLLLQLIVITTNFIWVFFFWMYGIDSVATILIRLIRKENIFKPHRTHLYQYLSNELRLPHLIVACIYALIQLAINALLIFCVIHNVIWALVLCCMIILSIYIMLRIQIQSRMIS